MEGKTGVYTTKKKNGTPSYRVSLTFRGKHISLGSFDDYDRACRVYNEGRNIVDNPDISLQDYSRDMNISHDKFIILLNYRDNGIYFATPIYVRKQYFEYYLTDTRVLKFDRDDLFFYAAHKIQQKGGYLFVSDYGSQYKLLSRYGIKPFAVYGRDYVMINEDKDDFRYSNIKILNMYVGVTANASVTDTSYTAAIHIIGNYIVGHYDDEITAAIAYNKAVDTLHANGIKKAFIKNYIASLKKEEYMDIYNKITISDKIVNYRA